MQVRYFPDSSNNVTHDIQGQFSTLMQSYGYRDDRINPDLQLHCPGCTGSHSKVQKKLMLLHALPQVFPHEARS